ncbi:rcc01693 family protein [Pseudaminobacter sp. NGMCC 1.201702]|uniref:rcc01693 family protein n=1 Tax=Pseudaminobacter sp. NGMCC 1.201702 TaxID=3391825 RepID=UPI0039F04B60
MRRAGKAAPVKPLEAAAASTNEFPWDEVMAAGFGLLRLPPTTFWGMTPREFERAMSVLSGRANAAPRRADLAELMRVFPDKNEEETTWSKR